MYLNARGKPLWESGEIRAAKAARPANAQRAAAAGDIFHSTGDSILAGGFGDDIYYLWDTTSKIVEKVNRGIDSIYSYAWGAVTLFDNVENLYLMGKGSTAGFGNALNNIIVAGSAGATLDGLAGNDVLVGGAGADVFRIAAGNGSDVIVNFTSGWDAIELKGYGFTGFADVRAAATQVGADLEILLAKNEKLILRDVSINDLSAYDFGFSQCGVATETAKAEGLAALTSANQVGFANNVYVFTNAWGVGGMKDGADYRLDATYDNKNLTGRTTFNWAFANTTDPFPTIKAYPEIIFGKSPFDTVNPIDPKFALPVKVSDIAGLSVAFDTEFSGNLGGFNVSYDIWFTSRPNGGTDTVTNELMIWTHKGSFEAFGSQIATYSDGTYTGKIFNNGVYIALVLDQDVPAGTIDLKAVFGQLQSLGLLSKDVYLQSVMLGAEVVSGVGSLSINKLDLTLQTINDDGQWVVTRMNGTGSTSYVESAPRDTKGLFELVDDNGLLVGYTSDAVATAGGMKTQLYDTGAFATGYDLVKTAGRATTTEHYGLDGKMTGAERVTVNGNSTSTQFYDSSYKLAGTDTTSVLGTTTTVQHYNAKGVFQGQDSITVNGTVTTALHYSKGWALTALEMTFVNPDGSVRTNFADGKWNVYASTIVSTHHDVTTTKVYGAGGVFVGGSEVHVDDAGVRIQVNHDARWAVTETVYSGTRGNDVIVLGDGANTVHSAGGNDVVKAGAGADSIFLEGQIGKDVMTVLDFAPGEDMFVLDHSAMPRLDFDAAGSFTTGSVAKGAAAQIVYDASTGNLYFDADGAGAGAAALLARLDSHLDLSAADFRFADAGDLGSTVPAHASAELAAVLHNADFMVF